MPFGVDKAYTAVYDADILLIVGTSLQIGYTLDMLNNVRRVDNPCRIIFVDPEPTRYLDNYGLTIEYIAKGAVEGITEVVNSLIENK